MIPQFGGFSDGLVDDRVERNDPPDELAPNILRLGELWTSQRQRVGESSRDFGRQSRESPRQPSLGASEIAPGEDDAGADDPDADLAGAGYGQHEGLPVRSASRAELVARDDGDRVARERGRVGSEVAQKRGNESGCRAPQRE